MSDSLLHKPARQPLLQVNALSVHMHGKTLLHPVRLSLEKGEKLAILGPNGAGKSTLLKCLAGDIKGYRGSVQLGQQPLQSLSVNQRARCLAVMPQHAEMLFPFRVAEVVALGRTPYCDELATRHWQQQAMQLTECWHLRDRRYPSLSGGEQQRVQLARVLVQIWQSLDSLDSQVRLNNMPKAKGLAGSNDIESKSSLLLLDECTSALDPAHQHSIMKAVDRFADAGVGVVAVMHDIALAAGWADRVVLMKHGEIIYQGSCEGLADATLLAQCYDLPTALAQRHASANRIWL